MKTKQLIKIVFCLLIILLIPIVSYFLITCQYKFHHRYDTAKINNRLVQLARQSLASKDVPVASVLLYHGKIIGEGYNTVLRDTNPAGHAEMNAIKNCMMKIGYEEFNRLDKTQLILITTYEPCPMCKGAIELYNIKNVVFALPKKISDKITYLKNDFIYYKNIRQNGNGRLQYDLFKMHPAFDSLSYPY